NSRIFCLQRDKLVGGQESNEELPAEQKRHRPDPHRQHQTEHPSLGLFDGVPLGTNFPTKMPD
ncbi:MAG: hypothetical protein O3C40_36995, partial [Planctomycetota bacterium]|nr:hypothetical protein [Planctomycetota bacterium]